MTIRTEKQGKVWTIIHSRPEAKNAMDPASAQALEDAFIAFERDAEAAVAVLWGEGGAFCAGFDLKHAAKGNSLEELSFPHVRPSRRLRSRTRECQAVWLRL